MNQRHELHALLGRIRRRWFLITLMSTCGRAAALAALPILAAALAGWLLRPSGVPLVILVAGAVAASVGVALFGVARRQRRPNDRQVARFVEERCAEEGGQGLADGLVTAVQIIESPDDQPTPFAPFILAHALGALRNVDPSVIVPVAVMRRSALEAVVGLAIFVSAVAAAFPFLLRATATVWVAAFPASIDVSVHPGDTRVAAGQRLRIDATLRGRAANLLGVVPSLVVAAEGQQQSVAMSGSSGRFAFTFESVDRSFQYRVAAGSAQSRAYSVTALFPPRLTRIDAYYEYPPFIGQAPRTEEGGGDIYAPAGTRVRLRVHSDKQVKAGEVALVESKPVPLSPAADGTASATLVLTQDDAYRVRLTDADGLQSPGEVEYFIRVMDDRPPDVHIVRPAGDQGITPLEEVAIEARADDDYGVARFDLVYAVPGRAARTVPFTRVTGTDVAKTGTHLLAAEELNVQPGDVITYYARARDVARGKRPTETRSDIFFLEVKPFNEEFVAAQSQAMGGGAAGTQIDSLISAQKEIISATWNLERRSGAGRSETDMRAVERAQAELKARAEQMIRGGRRPGAGFVPQQVVPAQPPRRGTADGVSTAVAAMERAVEQLGQSRTAEAIPHEMQALQGLLQAQAEVRRRQVMQQSMSAAGQGGTSRTDRDLSALFDKELQRQQRTNYETSQSSQSPQEDTNGALERIRDLANRQEELARRQRGLAGAQASEEAKRQLQQLTREQQELQRQAEALEKQLQRSGANASGSKETSGNGSTSSNGTNGIRRAAEQMRNAAQEMQQQNAQGAAESSQRAADALRQSERQLRGGSADARQRAAGELQLEAQQIADAQRRLASEVGRLEKQGAHPNPDGARRLAADKDKLADRVDELQRAARELGQQTPGGAATPLRDAANQLQGERISERIRATAKQMRDRAGAAGTGAAKPSSPQAAVEQQLSRALDAVVDRLGGNSEARRLSEQLDQAREIRDRLNNLEQQVRAAEKNAANGQRAKQGAASQRNGGERGQARGTADGAQQQLQQARENYARELERSRDALSRMQSAQQQSGLGGSTPEHHEFSRSAPGNEGFKQDFSGWEKLRQDVDVRLERYESAVSARLVRKLAEDGLSAGGSDRVPDAYRSSVAKYFQSIAKGKP